MRAVSRKRTFILQSIVASILAALVPGFLISLLGLLYRIELLKGILAVVVGPSMLVTVVFGPLIVWILEDRKAGVGAYLFTGFLFGSVSAILVTATVLINGLAFLAAIVLGGLYGMIVGALLAILVTFIVREPHPRLRRLDRPQA
jgi:hypothetical protein